jgi:hypothetical protein
MTQADFTIANQTFPNTRTELNTSLQALATNSAGNSAPSTTFPSQWWFDSDGNQLYIRNKDNDAWVKVFTIGATSDKIENLGIDSLTLGGATPTLTIGDGGAEDAKIIFDGNAQNFSMGLDDSTDLLTIGLGNTLGQYPAITIDENTNVVIPDSSLTVIGTGNYDIITLKSTDADSNVGPVLNFTRDSSSPANDDFLGELTFQGDNNAGETHDYIRMFARILNVADGSEQADFIMKDATGNNIVNFAHSEVVFNDDSVTRNFRVESNGNANTLFVNGGTDRVGVGTNAPAQTMHIRATGNPSNDTGLILEGGATDANVALYFYNSAGTEKGRFLYDTDDNFLQTKVNGSERMRIASDGDIHFAHTTFSATTPHLTFFKEGQIYFVMNSSSSTNVIRFYNSATGNVGGNINMSGDSTSYNSGSDYRLKDNVNYSFDATTRLKQLKPARFNFINTPDTTVDGFLAHEAQTVVPESVTGVHNETETRNKVVVNSNGIIIADDIEEADWTAGKVADEDGNTKYPTDSTWEASKVVPVYQSIDHSKIVPLLVKTIQELEARITALES